MKSLNSTNAPDDLIHIGKIIGVHGVNGAVRMYPYAESKECFAPGNTLVIVDAHGASIPYEIIRSQAYKTIMRMTLARVTTRELAEALVGSDVFIAKSALPPLEPDTYYWSDLIGIRVYTAAGEHLGEIAQIIPTGANDVYVVKTPAGYPVGEILIPAIASVVLDTDVEQRRMTVELPEGLL